MLTQHAQQEVFQETDLGTADNDDAEKKKKLQSGMCHLDVTLRDVTEWDMHGVQQQDLVLD